MTISVNNQYDDTQSISLLAYDQYVREVTWIQTGEPPSKEEEKQLLAMLLRAEREPGNSWVAMRAKHAHTRLIEVYQPLVIAQVKRVSRHFRRLDEMDLVQEGNLGLLDAIKQYVKKCHVSTPRFIVLAAMCIRHALWNARYELDGEVRLSPDDAVRDTKLQRLVSAFVNREGREPSVQELVLLADLSQEQVVKVQTYAERRESVSLQASLYEGEDAEERHNFVNLFQSVVQAETTRQVQLRAFCQRVFEHELNENERQVITVRYGLDDGVSTRRPIKMVAEITGKSCSFVDALDRRATAFLKQAFEPLVSSGQQSITVHVEQDDYYSYKEVMELLGLTSGKMSSYVEEGRLSVVRGERRYRGRLVKMLFHKAPVDALVRECVEQVSA